MHQTSYQIDLPPDAQAVVFFNGIKALNFKGFFWLWQQIFTTGAIAAAGCVETKMSIRSPNEAVIVSYWRDEASLMQFFHSSTHRQMMKDMTQIITADPKAIAVFNEIYRPVRSGKYFNEPQGLAKIYPIKNYSRSK